MSPIRERALAIIAEVVPSQYGDARFTALTGGWVATTEITTCGFLPKYVLSVLGATGPVVSGGLVAVRDDAMVKGAWRTLAGGGTPQAGDVLIYNNAKGEIAHIGHLAAIDGATWKTADAGQGARGTGQSALYVPRTFDAKAGSLTSATGGTKYLAGWLDLEAYPFPPIQPTPKSKAVDTTAILGYILDTDSDWQKLWTVAHQQWGDSVATGIAPQYDISALDVDFAAWGVFRDMSRDYTFYISDDTFTEAQRWRTKAINWWKLVLPGSAMAAPAPAPAPPDSGGGFLSGMGVGSATTTVVLAAAALGGLYLMTRESDKGKK